MSRIYDNWERLVSATLRREQLWQLAHAPSISSRASDFSTTTTLSYELPNLPSDISTSSNSWYHQNPNSETGVSRWGYNGNEIKQLSASENIFVNGKPLSTKGFNILHNCLNQPKKLKPGCHYWYDKYTGFWGKRGQKPLQIISANLEIAGRLEVNASNGNTEVYINYREITTVELRMLKLAGVRCFRDTHIWLNEDGTYIDEGGQHNRESIWGKAGMKLVCSLLSLPFPHKSSHTSEELLEPDYFDQKDNWKLLLLGCRESGRSTIFKQAVFLHKDIPFLEDELEYIKLLIQTNLYRYIHKLLEDHKHFEEENLNESRNGPSPNGLTEHDDDASDEESRYSFGTRLNALSGWLLNALPSGSSEVLSASLIQASAPLIQELLTNPAFQEIFNWGSELERMSNVAKYFLKRAVDILELDYKPSRMDILYVEGFPSSVSYTEFLFGPPNVKAFDIWYLQDYMTIYQLIKSNSSNLTEGDHKSFESDDTRLIIFSISLTDYDQFVIDDNGNSINKMMLNRECFKEAPMYTQKPFLLLLTKYDLFDESLRRTPLNQCDWFSDFNPIICRGNVAEMGFHYISIKFKELYRSLTGGKLYVAKVNSLEQNSVDAALKYARYILKWNDYCNSILDVDYSSDGSFSSVEYI